MESEIMQINLTEIYNTVVSNINAWLPTVTSVLSTVIVIFIGIARVKRACNDIKSDKTLNELRDEVKQEIATNKEAQRINRRLINKLLKLTKTDEEE